MFIMQVDSLLVNCTFGGKEIAILECILVCISINLIIKLHFVHTQKRTVLMMMFACVCVCVFSACVCDNAFFYSVPSERSADYFRFSLIKTTVEDIV